MISSPSQDLISLCVRCSELATALAAGGRTQHKGDVEASMCGLIYLFFWVKIFLTGKWEEAKKKNSSSANKHRFGKVYI